MPRHTNLIPLSHDHHEALLIALRLKKGGPTSQHDHLWSTELPKQLHSLQLFFKRELLPHFKLEEDILFPAAMVLEELHPLIESLLAQHEQIRKKISTIFLITDDDLVKNELADFGLLLESHIRSEERELFPKLEAAEVEGRVKVPMMK